MPIDPAKAAEARKRAREEQTCPQCGRAEARGSYCTGCLTPTPWYATLGQPGVVTVWPPEAVKAYLTFKDGEPR